MGMTSDLSNKNQEYELSRVYYLWYFEGPDVISVLKNLVEHSFVFLSVLWYTV